MPRAGRWGAVSWGEFQVWEDEEVMEMDGGADYTTA